MKSHREKTQDFTLEQMFKNYKFRATANKKLKSFVLLSTDFDVMHTCVAKYYKRRV